MYSERCLRAEDKEKNQKNPGERSGGEKNIAERRTELIKGL